MVHVSAITLMFKVLSVILLPETQQLNTGSQRTPDYQDLTLPFQALICVFLITRQL